MIFLVNFLFDLVEKIMKIDSWEEEGASNIVLIALIIVFLVVSFIPLRFIICILLLDKFHEGSTWYERRWINNEECCKIEIRNFFYNQKSYSPQELTSSDDWFLAEWPEKNFKPIQLKEYL